MARQVVSDNETGKSSEILRNAGWTTLEINHSSEIMSQTFYKNMFICVCVCAAGKGNILFRIVTLEFLAICCKSRTFVVVEVAEDQYFLQLQSLVVVVVVVEVTEDQH